jgi:valyl-tRNA synthetase
VERSFEKINPFLLLALVKKFELGRILESRDSALHGSGCRNICPNRNGLDGRGGEETPKRDTEIEKENDFVMKKLSNEKFLSKAPPEIVQEVKEKALEYRDHQEKLEESLNKIKEMIG